MKNSGLSEQELEQIRAVLRAVPAIEKAVLFGSRAMGLARGNSDVDIMLYGEKLTMGDVAHARALLEETTLPYQFDLVLCDAENAALQEHVRQYGKVMFEKYEHKRILHEQWENAGGCLPATWDITSFGELLLTPKSMSVGVMYPGTHTTGGIPLVKIGDVNDGVIQKPTFCISHEVNREYNRTQLDGYELLITLVGNPGECIVVDKSMAGWNVARAIACARISNPDMRYYVKCIIESKPGRNIVDGYLNTTVQKTLNLKELREIPIPLPPQKEIHSLAEFVFKVNSRIQLLRETNATLEAMAQALFKSWFVDFDPVHAKAEGRTPAGMDAETAALFPAEFEESELGMIPKGWICGSLIDIASYLNGLALQKYPASEGKSLPVIKIAQLRKGNTEGADRASASLPNDYIVKDGDVLFSWSGSLEVEIWCGGVGALNQHLFKVSSGKYPKWFYYFWTKYHLNEFRMIAASKATTMGHIQRKHLTEARVLIPSGDALKKIDAYFSHYIDLIVNNLTQARTLTALRNTLLPRLISGKLRLPEFTESTSETAV